MKAVSVKNLTFAYSGDDTPALSKVSFDVDKGGILLVIGESGCGKTTLLKHLKPSHVPVGTRNPSADIRINGKSIDELSEYELSFSVGFVGQQVDEMQVTDKVWHELAFGLESMGCDRSYMQQRVAEMTAFFGLESVYHSKLSELSGGQKQLVNLCSVMIMEPEILVLDEPTSQLDPNSAMEFFHMIRKIREEIGTTVIISEHRLEDIIPMADKVLVLHNGRVINEGAPKDICRYLYEKRLPLFRAMPVAARIFCNAQGMGEMPLSVNEGRRFIEEYMKAHEDTGCGTESSDISWTGKVDDRYKKSDMAIKVDEVWFRYKKNSVDVLKALSLDIPKGKITAVVGGNGAGKSTMLHIIMENLAPYMGKVKIFDDLSLGLLPQNPQAMFGEKTVRAELYSLKDDHCDLVVERFGLNRCLDRHPFDLSGGEMEKLALAKLHLMDYDILLLDEPGKGMDYAFKEKLGAYLNELTEKGKTILLVSHDVEFCAKYAHYCGMFFDGHIVAVKDARSFFLQNSFYTTAVRRMCKGMFDAVTVEDVLYVLGIKEEEGVGVMSDDFPEDDVWENDSTNNDIDDGDDVANEEDEEKAAYVDFEKKKDGKTESKNRGKDFFYKIAPYIVFLVIMPITIYIGYAVLHQRKYYFISIMLILEAVGAMFIGVEGTRPKLKEIMTIAVMSAITALSRAMFYMVPAVKPTAALTVISGIGMGSISGFVVGALSMLVSDIFFSQGPWTPWQMFSMGLLGFIAGLIFNKDYDKTASIYGEASGKKSLVKSRIATGKGVNVIAVCIYGILSVILIYGGIMNPASVLMYQENVTWQMLVASYAPGIPIDCIHGVATFIFLLFLTEPMLEKLERVRRK